MKKSNLWFKIFLTTLALTAPISFAVLIKERIRKNVIIDQDFAYYNALQTDLANFQKAQVVFMAEQVQKNKQGLESAKITYDYLLRQQDAIVKDHSQYIQLGQATNTQDSTLTASNTGSASSKSTTTISKPVTTRTTKTS